MRLSLMITRAGALLIGGLFFLSGSLAAEPHFDHSLWNQFLKQYVNEAGEVNYVAAKENQELLVQYLEALDKAVPAFNALEWPLQKWPREEQLAFWLNAYHAGIVERVIQHYPIRSINDIAGVWTTPSIKVGTRSLSLNDIRANELMKGFRDEKINMALACSARSCPPFPREAFTAQRVEGQLFMLTQQRVQDERFVRLDPKKKRLFLSRIFNWYGDDFILDFGGQTAETLKFTPPEMAVLSFVRHYTQDSGKREFLEGLNFKIKYLPFDWSLAEWNTAASKRNG